MKIRVFPEHNYKGIYLNGQTFRIALDIIKPITELRYPEFYDVKITDTCHGNCPYCYMDSKSGSKQYDNVLVKIHNFFGEMSDNEKPFQVAIGGGEPTEHPDFTNILRSFDELGITPNYTTNGMFIKKDPTIINDIVNSTKQYCGGVALSCHPHLDYEWGIASNLFYNNNIKLNFHIIISDKESIDRFKDIYEEWNKKVDYFVLLPYSSQGRAVEKEINWEYLVSVMPKDTTKIAFGANFYPYLVKKPNLYNISLYEPESMSKFLDLKDMNIYPSSFSLKKINKTEFTEDIPDYGDVMTVKSFISACVHGAFIDYDGSGQPAKNGKMADIYIKPSLIGKIPLDATHIVWYNR